jgi:uncharacterized protein (DUF885 family)
MRSSLVPCLFTGLLFLHAGASGAQTASETLAKLCDEYWQGELRADPVTATSLGDRRYDALLEDITPEGQQREHSRLTSLREGAGALSERDLSAPDRVNRSALLDVLDGEIATLDCDFASWVVDPLDGPQVRFLNIPSQQPVRTPEEGRAMVERWGAMGPWLDTHMANLRAGRKAGRVATRSQITAVADEVNSLLATSTANWTLVSPMNDLPKDWTDDQRKEFANGLVRVVNDAVFPAFQRYRNFLRDELTPGSRMQEKAGIMNLPGGTECYRKLIRRHTSLDLSPEEIHKIGLDEVAHIRKEMQDLGGKTLGTRDLKEILRKLRLDPMLHFNSRDDVEAKAREALSRAQAATPKWFGVLPRTPCEVVRMEAHEEVHSTIAYYREPAMDGSRPGRYYISTYAPDTRPRYEAEALAFHEAVPGHHIQTAIAQELTGLPEFRKHKGCTAFVEGWGLYSERLANDMGLYSSDIDRMGMLSYDAWRACRLVVDTGMHAMGWSRQKAIQYMTDNTALAANNIENEVDRYITWPGQALAYKLGQREILALRAEGQKRLGPRFDIKAFHDTVLQNGAVSLPTLRQIVEESFAAQEGTH